MNSVKENILESSVQYIKSVGPKRAESFAKIGIKSIRDLLFYFPSRHLDRSTVLTAAKAYSYILNGYEGEVTVIGKVVEREKINVRNKEILKVQLKDNTGFFECVWFQSAKYFYDVFKEGEFFAVSAKPVIDKYDRFQFVHPDFDRITEEESQSFLHTGKIIPFYRIPKELKARNIGDFSLRRIIAYAVEHYADEIEETLPEEILHQHNLLRLNEAIKNFHFPQSQELFSRAKYRFKFEEIFYLELLLALRKNKIQKKSKPIKFEIKTELIKNFLNILPFELTDAQKKVLSEIKKDMLSDRPMNRLLQGDVGSGKTVVALIAMLIAVDSGYQAALMAPTEILADQHAKNISSLMQKLNEVNKGKKVKVSLLLGGQTNSAKAKREKENELLEADIIIGTHALIEEKVSFRNLGLVVIDEQHRFGVKQRADLLGKGLAPDVLIMSATPIPRTLTMTLYGDLDVSVINEMPKNRKPIKTVLRGEKKLPEIYKFIIDKANEGYQSFIVYPLIEESEKLDLKAATNYYEELKNSYLKKLNLGLIHGRMNWREKEEMMFRFLKKEFDVLVATTVIEVGIDIPDANIILINDAHRFGLSQLHQLRGRVGRSNKQAYCILVTHDKIAARQSASELNFEFLSPTQLENYKSSVRLQSMVKYNDGFKIAEIDLKLRGPGDIFGTKQSGFPELKFVNIAEDSEIIFEAKNSAFELISSDPTLSQKKNFLVRKKLLEQYKENIIYADIA
ncbi:RecG-like DNA helicase [Ignavibacterium album JCM 16511]|uniref:ATP-dependent DNA helicase RecG n=1 Tax=Ignavibacterium album (strain DSM 19864 / JCM 16511 / NBRC 101810 / Mat9-16) TaxID=945713 RepID=I0AP87_IGNAJ|nr:ATP-dependent DNA helicase RecG [Ignavibacterium album]AFH50794.1 RecG-like DNA helicase [Ignavibacterium album JCM 16511]